MKRTLSVFLTHSLLLCWPLIAGGGDIPPVPPPECVECPTGYHCAQNPGRCVADPKPPTHHPAKVSPDKTDETDKSVNKSALTIVCGTEAQIARAKAKNLQASAATCRQDLANGVPYCTVDVTWAGMMSLTAAQADILARDLLTYARTLDDYDNRVQARINQFTVNTTHSTYTSENLRCSNVTTTIQSDRVLECQRRCYVQYGLPALDCWRGDIRELVFANCFATNALALRACSEQCPRSDYSTIQNPMWQHPQ